jgi:hypothetical protein
MARSAEAQGIPESAIFLEPQAMDTIQNACYSVRIMKAHGWRSAEVVASAAYHLPRAGLIFSRLPLLHEFRASGVEHAPAPPLSPKVRGLRERPRNRRSPQDCTLFDLGALGRPLRAVAIKGLFTNRPGSPPRVVPSRRGPVSWC